MTHLFTTGSPLNFSARAETPNSVFVSWAKPAKAFRNGDITQYTVVYYKQVESLGGDPV